jgi:adenosine 3'-phospho 5'-phosphosulfate transporter B3
VWVAVVGVRDRWITLVWTGELGAAYRHSVEYPQVPVLIISSSIRGYVSVAVVLLLIGQFGATNTEIIKSLKKVLSVVLSFVVYPKPIGVKYMLGLAACVASLGMTHQLRQRKLKAGGSTF